MKKKSFLNDIPLTEFMDWLEIADTCNLEKLMDACTEWLVIRRMVSQCLSCHYTDLKFQTRKYISATLQRSRL
jgi:hypothetical protein